MKERRSAKRTEGKRGARRDCSYVPSLILMWQVLKTLGLLGGKEKLSQEKAHASIWNYCSISRTPGSLKSGPFIVGFISI